MAGSIDPRGYLKIRIDYQFHYAHRLVWLFMTGSWPQHQIDHIDQDKSNNRWANLRAATNKQNMENSGLRRSNKSGVTGVAWSPIHKKWRARIKHNYRGITIGYFNDLESAVAARRSAETALFTHAQPQVESPDDPVQPDGTASGIP